jgi:putative solute:sodium symporter small subunit
MDGDSARRHWRRSRRLMWLGIVLGVLAAVGGPLGASQLNLFRAGGFPLGFYVAAEGAATLATVLTLLLVWRQEAIDRTHTSKGR